ncbi:MAG: DNA-processing protein DprA [Verrucomicrobia bacterium]|nr:DNA-processing protein DprA [Verrucomicrobiota bacterium]
MTPLESLIILNALPNVGSVKIRLLIEHFGSADGALSASQAVLGRVAGIGEQIAHGIAHWREHLSDPGKELEAAAAAGLQVVSFYDHAYPANLKEIYDPPIVLYVKGTLEERDRHAIAIVGSRRTTNYGRTVASRLARDLVTNGFTVVSGLALGIDTAAHLGAIEGGGRTVAALGSGLARFYPPENAGLAERIAESGAVISEFHMNCAPSKNNFPIRNRIISGLALGTVVVEAPTTSGAMITATHALGQNRQVFAVPGRIDFPTFKGNHRLIKEGAKLVESAEDVLSEFDYLFPQGFTPGNDRPSAAERPQPILDGAEAAVYAALNHDEVHIEQVIQGCGLPPGEVSVALLSLEMKHLVKQLPGKYYVRLGP